MINLLPLSEKQILLEEEKWKLILILSLIILIFFISLSLILFSIKIFISSQLEAQKVILSQEEKVFGQTEIQDFQKEINQTNLALLKLNTFYKQKINLTEFLEKIPNLLPKGIFLTQISISPIKKEENKFQVSLSGYTPLIEDLIELRENLKKENELSQIYFPPSIWVETKDIDFNITFQAILKK